MPEGQIPEQDPITTKSYALHYTIAIVVLIGTLLWAMWDEAYGQRPWKRYQRAFQERYISFLKQARSTANPSIGAYVTAPIPTSIGPNWNRRTCQPAFAGVKLPSPTQFPWGREIHIIDPGGVCWHVRHAAP